MDIHRCRFVPYNASAINAVAFSHPNLLHKKHSKTTPVRLAIGRANGDIEIWNPLRGSWLHEMTIPGGRNRSIEGLVWTVDEDEEVDGGRAVSHGRMRLFSIGYTNAVTEWDLEKACALRHASGQHGDIWCLAAQPRSAGEPHRLVGGTMTGCLVLYSTEDDDLRYQRMYRTSKKTVKMTCIAFQSRHIAVVGCSDSMIRVFDLRSGAVLHALSLGRDLPGGARDVIVWSLRCLPSGDFVSGDSTGQICIWDSRTFTQAQRIQSHTQDVLSLATSADGSAIVSGGMDRRVALYRQMPGKADRWSKVWHRRYHCHDVKALAAFESKDISVVVAGGPDAVPVVLPLRQSGVENHRALSHLPQSVPVASASRARLIVAWWEREAHIWSIDATLQQLLRHDGAAAADTDLDRHRRRVGVVQISGDANIAGAAISADGALLVLATTCEVKAFQLRHKAGAMTISKVPVSASAAGQGATAVAVSPDGRWVCLARGVENHVTLLQVKQDQTQTAFRARTLRLSRLRRAILSYELSSGLGRYDRRTTHIAFSPDSRMLATADIAGYVDTWVLRGAEVDKGGKSGDAATSETSSESSDDESEEAAVDEADEADEADGERWIRNPQAQQFPKLSGSPVVLSFAPDVPGQAAVAGMGAVTKEKTKTTKTPKEAPKGKKAKNEMTTQKGTTTTTTTTTTTELARDYVLVAITAANQLLAFHPLRARLAPWFRRLGRSCLPVEYRNIRDLAKGVLWQGPRMWIYGASFVFMIDTSLEPEAAAKEATGTGALVSSSSRQEQQLPVRKRKRGTGAGNKMTQSRLEPEKVRMVVPEDDVDGGANGVGGNASKWVDVDMEDAGPEGEEEEEDDDDDSSSSSSEEEDVQGPEVDATSEKPHKSQRGKQLQAQTRQQQQQQQQQKRWWHTFKFRPILGVVPLGTYKAAPDSVGAYPPLEVALVERPGWDIELPERYDE